MGNSTSKQPQPPSPAAGAQQQQSPQPAAALAQTAAAAAAAADAGQQQSEQQAAGWRQLDTAAAAGGGGTLPPQQAAEQQLSTLPPSPPEQPAATAAGPPPDQQQPQPDEDDGDVSPMLMTSLTQRFRGRFQPLHMPTYESMQGEDLMNNCGVKSCIAGAMGGLLGVAFGVFTASLDTQGIDTAPMGETKPTRVVLRETWVLMKDKSRSYAKGFAGMGFLYSGTECLIEKYRAKHDKFNATLAGCATGGLMAAPGGAKAMCFGCASFAAFSTAIEYWTG